ncbi:unnamed protein product [Nyctereutes procyonoides]|uniref:(raccoon dog) hypothetical protein n=1 Tax=Nyctereutes procyonoides TaxID=34880 RepID=A0A811YE65_NYCPR|nr:unnamed protein product [Nyctereutes procyonoides]
MEEGKEGGTWLGLSTRTLWPCSPTTCSQARAGRPGRGELVAHLRTTDVASLSSPERAPAEGHLHSGFNLPSGLSRQGSCPRLLRKRGGGEPPLVVLAPGAYAASRALRETPGEPCSGSSSSWDIPIARS